VRKIAEESGLIDSLGSEGFFTDKQTALNYLRDKYDH